MTPLARVDSSGDVVPAGDVNGDGVGDLGLGPFSERAEGRRCEPLDEEIDSSDTRNWQDAAEVAFGGPAPGLFDRDAVGPAALRVHCVSVPQLEDRGPPGSGVSYGGATGGAIAGVGDVDGDGLADFAVGSRGAGARGRPNSGTVHIVLGRREPGEVDARTLGDRGVRIDGPERGSELGGSIVPLGDVDGDGRPDLALPYKIGVAAPNGRRLNRDRFRVAVVFGGFRGGEQVDLAAPGDRVTVLTGLAPREVEDIADDVALAALGDVDGDGGADVAVGQPYASSTAIGFDTPVRVVRIRRSATTVNVRRERPIMVVRGPGEGEFATALAPAGDVDGDGRQDLAVAGSSTVGTVSVVPTRPGTTVDLDRPPAGVRTITGSDDDFQSFGDALAPLGDVDADGIPDLLVGQPDASPDCRSGAGAAWVVPGARGGGAVAVAAVPGAWRMDGAQPAAELGARVASADLTGDGVPELVLPALPFADAAGDDVRLVAAQRPASELAALPAAEACFGSRVLTRTLRGLRSGRLVVRVRSSMGTGAAHRIQVTATVVGLPSRRDAGRLTRLLRGMRTAVARARFAGPEQRRIVVRLTPRMRRTLRGAGIAFVHVRVRQARPSGWTAEHELTVAR